MKILLTPIIFVWTFISCTHQQLNTSQDKMPTSELVSKTIDTDSIDRYGYSDCSKISYNELNDSFKKSLDSTWKILLVNDKLNEVQNLYSKNKFKKALIANNFIIDSSDNWITATKKSFNERWKAEWDKDTNYVQLTLTRWYKGNTYQFFIGSDRFYQ